MMLSGPSAAAQSRQSGACFLPSRPACARFCGELMRGGPVGSGENDYDVDYDHVGFDHANTGMFDKGEDTPAVLLVTGSAGHRGMGGGMGGAGVGSLTLSRLNLPPKHVGGASFRAAPPGPPSSSSSSSSSSTFRTTAVQMGPVEPIPGGVTSLEVPLRQPNPDRSQLVLGTDTGFVCIVAVESVGARGYGLVAEKALKIKAFAPGAAVTAVSVASQQQVVAVTDAGGIFLVDLEAIQAVAASSVSDSAIVKVGAVDNSALYDVTALQDSRVFVTAGASPVAQLKIWDPRAGGGSVGGSIRGGSTVGGAGERAPPVALFSDGSVGNVGYTSVVSHPTRRDIVAAGTSDGELVIWDIRQTRSVVNRLKQHRPGTMVTDLRFDMHQVLYSCGADGAALKWDFHAYGTAGSVPEFDHASSTERLSVEALWPTPPGMAAAANTVDVHPHRDAAVVAYDDGAVHWCY